MFVHGDFYESTSDVQDTIERLIMLKEKIESIENTDVIDEAVDVLYQVIENADN